MDKTFGVFNLTKESKTKIGTQAPELYWTVENFAYIDRFLMSLSKEFIIEFKQNQYKYFQETIQIYKKWKLKMLEREILVYNFKNISVFQNWISECDSFILYGAGTIAEILYPLIKNKILKVIDTNKSIHSNYLGDHIIEPVKNIHIHQNSKILITAFSSKEDIKRNIFNYGHFLLYFLEDMTKFPTLDTISKESYEFHSRFIS